MSSDSDAARSGLPARNRTSVTHRVSMQGTRIPEPIDRGLHGWGKVLDVEAARGLPTDDDDVVG